MDADVARSRELAAALVRLAGGDRAALRLLYQETSAKLFGACLRILEDRSEAEDVLQEVYVTVWRKAPSFDPERRARDAARAWPLHGLRADQCRLPKATAGTVESFLKPQMKEKLPRSEQPARL